MATVIHFRVPNVICDMLQSYAREDDRPLSWTVREACEEYIAAREAATRKRARRIVNMDAVGPEGLREVESLTPGIDASVEKIAQRVAMRQAGDERSATASSSGGRRVPAASGAQIAAIQRVVEQYPRPEDAKLRARAMYEIMHPR